MQAKLAGYTMGYFANLVNYEKYLKCQHQCERAAHLHCDHTV